MDLGLKDRVAIVAASSRGLGKAVAMGLARQGVKLALCARTGHTLVALRGRFIAITSMTVKQPVEGLILSNSVRSAVSGLVKTLANEYRRYNVLVNNVCPGYTATARLLELSRTLADKEGVTPSAIEERWAAQTPVGRVGCTT